MGARLDSDTPSNRPHRGSRFRAPSVRLCAMGWRHRPFGAASIGGARRRGGGGRLARGTCARGGADRRARERSSGGACRASEPPRQGPRPRARPPCASPAFSHGLQARGSRRPAKGAARRAPAARGQLRLEHGVDRETARPAEPDEHDHETPAPRPRDPRAGRYRVRVPVYDSDMAAQQGTPSYEVTINFELPAPSGVVVVPIGQSP